MLKQDALVRDALNQHNLEKVNWEEDISPEREAGQESLELMVDTTLDLESEGLGNFGANARKADAFLEKASRR